MQSHATISVAKGNHVYFKLFTRKLLSTPLLPVSTVLTHRQAKLWRWNVQGWEKSKWQSADRWGSCPQRPITANLACAGQAMPSLLIFPRKAADTLHYAATYRHDELLNAVRGHTVQMSEVQLQMDLVVQHVLAERAAEHGLHWVLGHGVHPQPIHIGVTVLAVWALVHLQNKTRNRAIVTAAAFLLPLDFKNLMPSPSASYHLSPSFFSFILCFWHIQNKLPTCRCTKSCVLVSYLLWFGLLWSFWPFKGERWLRAAGKWYSFRGCWRLRQLLLCLAGWCCNKRRFTSGHPQRGLSWMKTAFPLTLLLFLETHATELGENEYVH